MKSELALILAVYMIGTGMPAAAQDLTGPLPTPLSHSLTREAIRLAGESAVYQGRRSPQQDPPPVTAESPSTNADWARVQKLESGTKIMLTVSGAPPQRRDFVRADAAVLTVRKGELGEWEVIARSAVIEIRRENLQGIVYRAPSERTSLTPPTKYTHGVLTGALIGAGVGAAIGAIAASKGNSVDYPDAAVVLPVALLGAGIGAVVGLATR